MTDYNRLVQRHPISRLINAPLNTPAGLLLLVVIGIAVLYGLYCAFTAIQWLSSPLVYNKDILQGYLMALAIPDGVNPFMPVLSLAERYLGDLPVSMFDHPTPHPPTLGLLLYPLGGLPYTVAATVWLALELLCMGAAVHLLVRTGSTRSNVRVTLVVTIASIGWFPVMQDLQRGQLSILILLLLTAAWAAQRKGNSLVAGALIGLSLVVKPLVWPVLLLLALRWEWRSLLGAALAVVPFYGLAAAVMGISPLMYYFSFVLPTVTAFYQNFAWNHSLWTIGYRLFNYTDGITVAPLLKSPGAAIATSVLIPALVLAATCLLTRRKIGLDWAMGAMLCVSTVVNPIAWPHYLVLTLIPATQVFKWLAARDFPWRETNYAIVGGVLLIVGHTIWERLAFLLAGETAAIDGAAAALPLAPSLLLLGPTVAALYLAWLMIYLGRRDRRHGLPRCVRPQTTTVSATHQTSFVPYKTHSLIHGT